MCRKGVGHVHGSHHVNGMACGGQVGGSLCSAEVARAAAVEADVHVVGVRILAVVAPRAALRRRPDLAIVDDLLQSLPRCFNMNSRRGSTCLNAVRAGDFDHVIERLQFDAQCEKEH